MGAGYTPGSNAGLRLAFELPPTMGGDASALLYATIAAYSLKGGVAVKNRLGVGDTTNFPKPRVVGGSAAGSASFTVNAASAPIADDWRGKTATLREYYDEERYIAESIKVTQFDLVRSEKDSNKLTGTIGWVSLAAPTFHWPEGETNTGGTAESVATQRQFAGSAKGYDPNYLQPPETVITTDWAATLDATSGGIDAAEYAEIQALIAAATIPLASPHNYKMRAIIFDRYSINGGTARTFWGLTTTDEDVINAATNVVADTHTRPLESQASVADFNQNPAAPADANLVLWTTTQKEYNDSMLLHQAEYRLLTPQEAREFPDTYLNIDVSDLTSEGKELKLYAFGSSAPAATDNTASGVQKVSTQIIRINEKVSGVEYGFAKDTSKQKWEQEHTAKTTDTAAFDIESGAETASVDGTPATPSNGDLVHTTTKFIPVTHDHDGNVYVWDLLDSNQKITFPGTHENLDPVGLTSDGISTQLFTFGGSAPAAPDYLTDGLQAVSREITRVNRLTSKAVDYFKVNKSDEQWVYDHVRKTTDPSLLKDLTILGAVFVRGSEPMAPGAADLVLNHKEYFELSSPNTSNKQGVLWFYGETTSADDEIFPHKKLDTDPYDLTSSAVTGAIVTTGDALGSPSAPTVPPSMVLEHWTDAPLTDASASNQTLRLYFWALRTSKDAIEEDGTHSRVDPVGIDSEGQTTQVYTTLAGLPGDATPPDASLKRVARQTQELNRIKSKAVDYFDVNASDEKWLFAHTKILADASSLKNLTIKGAVFTRGATPGEPGASGLVLNHTETFDITSSDTSNLQGILWFYAETTSADDELFPKLKADTDPSGLESSALTGAIVTTGAILGSPSAPSVPPNLKLAHWLDQPLTNASASNKSLRLYFWELTTSAEKIERADTFTEVDPNSLDSKAQQAFVASTQKTSADVTISLPTDVELDETEYKQLNDGLWKTIVKYAINNSKNLWERLKKKTTTDTAHIRQEVVVPKVLSSATPVVDDTYNPDTTNLQFFSDEVVPISATQFVHLITYRPLNSLNTTQEGFNETTDDPVSNLKCADKRRLVDSSATTAAPAVTVSGASVVCVHRLTQQIGKALYQHDFWYDFRSIANQHIADKTWTDIDLSTIPTESEAMTAEVWLVSGGAPSSPTLSGFALRRRRDLEIENPLYRIRVYQWGLATIQQEKEYAGSPYSSSVEDKRQWKQKTYESFAGDISSYAGTILAANQSTASFVNLNILRLTPTVVEVVKTFDDEDKKIFILGSHVVRQRVRGVPESAIVAGKYAPGNVNPDDPEATIWVKFNFGDLRACDQSIDRVLGRFKIRRLYSSTDLNTYTNWAVQGTCNKDADLAFLGRLKGEVMYLGPETVWLQDLSGARRQAVDHHFQTDNFKFFNDAFLPSGRVAVNSGSILATGGYPATMLEAGAVCVFPDRPYSFSGFIT